MAKKITTRERAGNDLTWEVEIVGSVLTILAAHGGGRSYVTAMQAEFAGALVKALTDALEQWRDNR